MEYKKMKKYFIVVAFALPTIITDKNIDELNEAINHANINLSLQDCYLSEAKRRDDYTIIFELRSSNSKINSLCDGNAIGNHLCGISKYLLKIYSEKYTRLKDGTRLLYYDVY